MSGQMKRTSPATHNLTDEAPDYLLWRGQSVEKPPHKHPLLVTQKLGHREKDQSLTFPVKRTGYYMLSNSSAWDPRELLLVRVDNTHLGRSPMVQLGRQFFYVFTCNLMLILTYGLIHTWFFPRAYSNIIAPVYYGLYSLCFELCLEKRTSNLSFFSPTGRNETSVNNRAAGFCIAWCFKIPLSRVH